MSLKNLAKLINDNYSRNNSPIGDKFCKEINSYLQDVNDLWGVNKFYAEVVTDLLNRKSDFIPWHNIPKPRLRASQMGDCKRSLFYQFIGEEEDTRPISALTRRKLDNGTFAHLRWQSYLKHMIHLGNYNISTADITDLEGNYDCNYTLLEGESYNEGLMLTGHYDMLISFEGKNYIIDFKTILHNSRGSATGFTDLVQVHDDYVKQFTAYAILTGINDFLVLYESKDTQEIKCFHLEITEEQKEEMKDFIAQLQEDALNLLLDMSTIANTPSDEYEVSQHYLRKYGYESNKCWKCTYKSICDRKTIKDVLENNNVLYT